MHSDRVILIASSSLDEPDWRSVAAILGDRGYSVVMYEADKVAYGTVPLEIKVTRDAGLHVYYNGCQLCLEAVVSAWYRRPTMVSREQEDKARQLTLDTERRKAQYPLWATVPERAWLSSPQRILHAEHKLTQLVLAREVGFDIP